MEKRWLKYIEKNLTTAINQEEVHSYLVKYFNGKINIEVLSSIISKNGLNGYYTFRKNLIKNGVFSKKK